MILLYASSKDGNITKSSHELASYGSALAKQMNQEICAVSFCADDTNTLSDYGISKIYQIDNERYKNFKLSLYSTALKQFITKLEAHTILFDATANSKTLAPYLSAILDASYISNILALPKSTLPFIIKRSCFSSKAFAMTEVSSDIKLLQLSKNAYGISPEKVETVIENFEPSNQATTFNILSTNKFQNHISITDAEVVVSGGRGLKGPENWDMLEELASLLGAATACSKPVSDQGWRPHSEHVGQTGKLVTANIYIAIGISGAIQHLAGVSASKTKIVINIDHEAPFFKFAEYGIIGDAFEVVPALINRLKTLKL